MRPMFRSKDAVLAMWPLVMIILTLVIMISLVILIRSSAETAERTSKDAACAASVAAHAKFGSEIDCPLDFIRITTRNGEEAKEQVADAMVKCWDNYGRGKLTLFQAKDRWTDDAALDDRGTKFCAVCSVVEFKRLKENLTGFPYFLATKSFSRSGVPYNYHEYLSGEDMTPELLAHYRSLADRQYLDPDYKYAILFTFYKDREWIDKFGQAVLGEGDFWSAAKWVVPLIGVSMTISNYYDLADDERSDKEAALSALREFRSVEERQSSGIIITHLNTDSLRELGCEKLPVSLTGIDKSKTDEVTPETGNGVEVDKYEVD